jgi:hypothetical protein
MSQLMLGKSPARLDPRTLRLSAILRTLPPLPPEYDLDQVLGVADDRDFGNLQYGDCVIAGRAHMTMRFEAFEQKRFIDIADTEVIGQYLSETGGQDKGLVMLDSLNKWRHDGWQAAGQHYDIHAFTSLNYKSIGEVQAAIYLLNGVYCGLMLPRSAQGQFDQGQTWDLVDGPDGAYGSWGGHCVYVMAYNQVGPVCMTWGRRQQVTWVFWATMCEEA